MTNSELKELFAEELKTDINREKLQDTVKASMAAFLENESERPLSGAEFLYAQSRYIKKRWWLIQALVLVAVWVFLENSHSDLELRRILGAAAPLFTLLILPELWKNRFYGAMEVECTSFYTIRQIYSARFMVFFVVDLLLLSLFTCIATVGVEIELQQLLIQFFLPMNVCACICFHCLYSNGQNSEIFGILSCFIWNVIWECVVVKEAIYSAVSTPVWNVLLVVSLVYLVYSIICGQKKCERNWEAQTLWN